MTFDELLELSDIENVSRGDKEVLEVMRKVFNTLADGEGEGGGDSGGGGEVTPAAETEIFIANYGETTAAEITQAINEGKLCICLYNGFNNGIAWLTASILGEYYFNKVYGLGWIQYHVAGENWNSTSGEFVRKNNAVLTGQPVVSSTTPPDTDSSDRIATTRFVQRAIAYHLNQLDITGDYDDLTNKPSINGVTLSGNKTSADLGLDGGGGLSTGIKQALLACFRNVAWANEDGSDYYAALETALTGTVTLTSISASFVQGSAVIYPSTPLNQLKQYLTVTASYSDGTSATVVDYTLSGTLAVGTSTITVSYENEEDTFNVTVTAEEVDTRTLLYNWDLTNSIIDTVQGASLNLNSDATQSNSGVTIGQGGQFYLTQFRPSTGIHTNRDYEFDISAMTHDYTGHGRFITFGPSNSPTSMHSLGFIYRSTGSWQFYFTSWSTNGTETSATAFVGKTLKLHIDENYLMTAYVDGVEIASATVPNTTQYESIYVGDTSTPAYTTTLTGIRIYSTEGA